MGKTFAKWLLFLATLAWLPSAVGAQSFRARLPEDEIIYFLLPDRFENGDTRNDKGGISGDRLKTGFDPSSKGFYHGGDLKGLTRRLDYIQSLGATAVWLAPIFKNKPVQGAPGSETAGYHGYWITDFTTVDPHFGTDSDFREFVQAAHSRKMKVYMDIITNHTADVISYKECPNSECAYRSRADYPYSRRGADGKAINPGFLGEATQTTENFAKLADSTYAYTPTVSEADAHIKKPDWLNDISLYHNRGNTTFRNESSTMGDFVGLDDLMTENPKVVKGFIDIYTSWIDKYGIDGFRVDTQKHVNPEFWQAFVPTIVAHAKAKGIPNFHIFGEVASDDLDTAKLATHTRVDKMPSVLDFAFRRAVLDTVAGNAGPDRFIQLFQADALYEGGAHAALRLPTFVSNHDAGRLGYFVQKSFPNASDTEILQRIMLANAMMMTLRGVPVIYAGDEQGFAGNGGDQGAREDMFTSQVAEYLGNKRIGSSKATSYANFDRTHPIYKQIAFLSSLRRTEPALRRGLQVIRTYSEQPGLFALSRIDPASKEEVLLVFNTSTAPLSANVEIDIRSKTFLSLFGKCPSAPRAPGSVTFSLMPLDYVICRAK